MSRRALKVAVIAFDQISPFHLSVPCLVFAKERRVNDSPWFDLKVCAGEPGELQTTAGFGIHCDHGLEALTDADIVIMPSWRNTAEKPPYALLEALRRVSDNGALIVGLCLGAFVIAAAGLLDGQRATTHWAWADELALTYPEIKVDPKVLYVESNNVMTSAGVAAGIDCCVHIVSRIYGWEIANALARRLVVSPQREGGQAQFIEQPIAKNMSDERMNQLLEWIRENLHAQLPIDKVSSKLSISRRTFTRNFKSLTGSSYNKWILQERLKLAKQYLETTKHSVEFIAGQCGFGTSTSLRQHFMTHISVSPSGYRKGFQSSTT
ncbi:GlxA family transcriptional regulator [Pseudomonas sp. TE21394]